MEPRPNHWPKKAAEDGVFGWRHAGTGVVVAQKHEAPVYTKKYRNTSIATVLMLVVTAIKRWAFIVCLTLVVIRF